MDFGKTNEGCDNESMDSQVMMSKRLRPKKNKFRNRSRLEIVSNLLTRAKSGALKTHLMYGANLSYPLMEEYLSVLVESGLIIGEIDIGSSSLCYLTTAKGLEYLEHYEIILGLLGNQCSLASGNKSKNDYDCKSNAAYESIEKAPRVAVH